MSVSTAAHAGGVEACFEGAQSFAVCNGFLAGIAGLAGVASSGIVVYKPDESDGGAVALGVGLGIYASISGGALLASSLDEEPGSTLRDTGIVLGAVDLALGGAALTLSALAGVAIALTSDEDTDDEDSLNLAIRFAVPGTLGATPGLVLGGTF